MGFVGTDGSVNVLQSADGATWTNRQVFSGSKKGLPGMASFNGHLHMFVHEFDDRAVWFERSGTNGAGTTMARSTTLAAMTGSRPPSSTVTSS